MRILTAFFTAALLAVPGLAKAAPRNIDDCEKIQAADAYNLCLASFGPVARGHHGFADGDGGAKENETASLASGNDEAAAEGQSRHRHRHAFKHGSTRHHWARHSSAQDKRGLATEHARQQLENRV